MLERNGFAEERCFSFSYSPVRDESGGVDGILDVAVETTSLVVSTRRLRMLQRARRGAEQRICPRAK